MLVLSCSSPVQLFETTRTAACQAPLWDFPDKNTGVGCHVLLTQGLNCISFIAGRFFTAEPLGKPPDIYQIDTLYTLKLHNAVCQLHLSTFKGKKKKKASYLRDISRPCEFPDPNNL